MSRKDYQIITAAIRAAYQDRSIAGVSLTEVPAYIVGIRTVVDELVPLLIEDNPHFNKDRFLRACFKGEA